MNIQSKQSYIRGRSRWRAVDRIATVAIIVVSVAILGLMIGDRFAPRSASAPAVSQGNGPLEAVDGLATSINSTARMNGQPRVAIVEFSDFECPFCGQYARNTYERIVDDYVKPGKITYVFKHFPLPNHRFAMPAAEAADCARQGGKFWQMHDRLFANQTAFDPASLLQSATAVGLDERNFSECIRGDVPRNAVNTDLEEGVRLEIKSTPTFFFGFVGSDGKLELVQRLTGAYPYAAFKIAIELLLQRSSKSS